MAEPAHHCRYCGRTFDGERGYLRHLERAHDPGELGRIDRHRIESNFEGRRTWWTDLLVERLATYVPVRTIDWLGSLQVPVPAETVRNLTLLGLGLTLLVAVVLSL